MIGWSVVLGLVVASGCEGSGSEPGPDAPAAEVVLEFGHVEPIVKVWRTGDRLVSEDVSRHWVLWDVPSRSEVASGDQTFDYLAVAGDLMIAHQPRTDEIEIRALATGDLYGKIRVGSDFIPRTGLAVDGSYVWLATRTSIQAWSAHGDRLFEVPGDFSRAEVHAARGELRVAADPTQIHNVELIEVPSGSVSMVSFAGQFVRWFDTGERFLTAAGTTAWVYAKTGQKVAFAELPTTANLSGQGDHVWTADDSTLRIYRATDLSAPLQSFALVNETPVPAAESIALVGTDLEFITLGATVTRGAPIDIACTAFGGDPRGAWAIGTVDGLVFDRAEALAPADSRRSLSVGKLLGLAGAPGGTAALSTASGLMLLQIDAAGAKLQRTLPLAGSDLRLTLDGSTLVLNDLRVDNQLHVVNVTDGSDRHIFPSALAALAPRGNVLARWGADGAITYTDLDGAPVAAPGPTRAGRLRFSPDGEHIAATLGVDRPTSWPDASTQIYRNGKVTGAVEGVAEVWLDDGRLLAAQYIRVHAIEIGSLSITDPSGSILATPKHTFAGTELIVVGDDLVYSPANNWVGNAVTGENVWTGDSAELGARIGPDTVVYAAGPHLFRASFRDPAAP